MAYKLKSYHEIILFVRASFLLQLSTEATKADFSRHAHGRKAGLIMTVAVRAQKERCR